MHGLAHDAKCKTWKSSRPNKVPGLYDDPCKGVHTKGQSLVDLGFLGMYIYIYLYKYIYVIYGLKHLNDVWAELCSFPQDCEC